MPNYQKMYSTLFQHVTAAIDTLQQAQRQTEEIYLSSAPTAISLSGVKDTAGKETETNG